MGLSRLRFKRLIMFALKLLMIIFEAAAFGYVWYNYYKDLMPVQYYERGNWAVIGVYACLALIFNKLLGALKVGYHKTWDVLLSQFVSIILTNSIMYVILVLINGEWAIFKHFSPVFEHVGPMLCVCLVDLVIAIIWSIILRYIYVSLFPPHKMLLVHGVISPNDVINTISKRADRYDIEETICIDEGIDAVCRKMEEYESVLIGDIPSRERNDLIKHGFDKGIRCYGLPKISDIMIRSAESINLFDTPLLLYRDPSLKLSQIIIKRFTDIVISLIAFIPCSVIMLVIAILIKSYDHGPVFYKQERLTLNGKEFYIYKFRSMVVDAEKNGARLAKKSDDRITPVGKVIRRLHFDEIPQIFNILKGDMSLVGPRPERREIAEKYKKSIPEFDFRLKVKAGLTGYAQVYGQYNTTPYDKLKLDLTYIENYSLALDLKLIFLTAKIFFMKEKSLGVDDQQKTALKK